MFKYKWKFKNGSLTLETSKIFLTCIIHWPKHLQESVFNYMQIKINFISVILVSETQFFFAK
jgi:hypothetical protein